MVLNKDFDVETVEEEHEATSMDPVFQVEKVIDMFDIAKLSSEVQAERTTQSDPIETTTERDIFDTKTTTKLPTADAGSSKLPAERPPRCNPRKKPTLWQLTGRTVRKSSVGKAFLDGVQGGALGTKSLANDCAKSAKRMMNVDIGSIHMHLSDPMKAYKPEETVAGKVVFQLTEPVQASGLMLTVQAFDRAGTYSGRNSFELILESTNRIDGKRTYYENEEIPFNVCIPFAIPATKPLFF